MNDRTRNSWLLIGAVLGAISLPMTWLTVDTALLPPTDLATAFLKALQASLDITGVSGSFRLLGIAVPSWALIALSAMAALLQILNNTRSFQFPYVIRGITALVPAVWLVWGFADVLMTGAATLGLGGILALISVITPLATVAFFSEGASAANETLLDQKWDTVANRPQG